MINWFRKSLNRKLAGAVLLTLLVLSSIFLLLFQQAYRVQLQQERENTIQLLNGLLRSSLENAMLKMDLQGLSQILSRFGEQEGVISAMVANPRGEVRFASDHALLGNLLPGLKNEAGNGAGSWQPYTILSRMPDGSEVLRGIYPVMNQPPCQGCHGSLSVRPVNGFLIVDFEAGSLRQQAVANAAAMAGAGFVVTLLTLSLLWWLLHRWVVLPVRSVEEASRDVAAGAYGMRLPQSGLDETGRLAVSFNIMAEAIQANLSEIKRQQVFLQTLVDAMPDAVRVIAGDFRIVLANHAYCSMLGVSHEEVIGRPCHVSSHRRAEPCIATLQTCPLAELKSSQDELKFLQRFEDSHGGHHDVEIHAAAIGNSTAPAEGRMIVEVIRDLGQEVRFSHEQRLASLGQLAAGVAHEIRNPLGSIKIALHALLHADPDRIARDAEMKQYLELVEGQVDICVQVTEKLLRLSLYSDGTAELMDVNRAVSETASLMAYESEKAGVRTDIRLHPQGLRIMAAEGDIRMALLNLLQNALHAMPRGGVLSLATREEGDWAVIDVVDTGVGISSEIQQHVFEPFFSRRADGQKGTGLGLAIARSLVRRHGGMIEMESEVGKGSRFTMRFPTAEKHFASIVEQDEA